MGLPYLGYLLAYVMAKVLKQSQPDCLAIAIEAGIQNTGIAIFLLRFSLPQPEADLTTGTNNPLSIYSTITSVVFYFKWHRLLSQ